MAGTDSIVDYERLLALIGRYIQRERLAHICILEVEGGIVVQGIGPAETADSTQVLMKTKSFDHAALQGLARLK